MFTYLILRSSNYLCLIKKYVLFHSKQIGKLISAWKNKVNGKDLLFIQCSRNAEHIILNKELSGLATQAGFTYKNALENGEHADHQGYLNEEVVQEWLDDSGLQADGQTAIYFCGPKPFMSAVNQLFKNLGFDAELIHYETFGPSLEL